MGSGRTLLFGGLFSGPLASPGGPCFAKRSKQNDNATTKPLGAVVSRTGRSIMIHTYLHMIRTARIVWVLAGLASSLASCTTHKKKKPCYKLASR